MVGRVLAILFGVLIAFGAVFLLLWALWLLWKRFEEEGEALAIEIEVPQPPTPAGPPEIEVEMEVPVRAAEPLAIEIEAGEEEEAAEPEELLEPDDLKRIEGIGPKFSSVLQEAGIATFAQLADLEVGRIRQILEEADPRLLRLADPTTWPEQAGLAAADDWDGLRALQDQLRGGRR
jgi:predicted flap endonuclease-1-like 5' DNA nuclease